MDKDDSEDFLNFGDEEEEELEVDDVGDDEEVGEDEAVAEDHAANVTLSGSIHEIRSGKGHKYYLYFPPLI